MNRYKILLQFLLPVMVILLVASCSGLHNPKERNHLVFKDDIAAVADSVEAMSNLLLKTGKEYRIYTVTAGDGNDLDSPDRIRYLYLFNDSIGVQNIGLITDSTLYKNAHLSFIDSASRKRFVNLAYYLSQNELDDCGIYNGLPLFLYRDNIYMADYQTDLRRMVVFTKSENLINLNELKILDKSNNLYLISEKDAKIWSDSE